ncbi:unnamed protein product [Sphagnum jensenii]|uniref:Tetratricopeptide repeat domain 7A n=1 Tax=Sphagnum jensenii TaxID=128206 RepID=A0ABP0WUX3_9BRYO
MLCTCTNQFKNHGGRGGVVVAGAGSMPEGGMNVELASRELCAKIKEGETKLEEGSIEEAETSLREALSLNNEEARALLGRLEYQRGNIEGALQVFEGIELTALVSRMRFFLLEAKNRNRKGKPPKDGTLTNFLHAASLLLEAIYLKAKSLQKLGRLSEAASECKNLVDTMETAVPAGIPSTWGDTKVAEMVAKAVHLLPQLLLQQSGCTNEALSAYRRALRGFSWCLDVETQAVIQKEFAVLLLYGGVEATSMSVSMVSHVVEGGSAFVPKNNTEEAILLLMLLLCSENRKVAAGGAFDTSVIDHLCFALSVNGQSTAMAHQYEELLPGILSRPDRWYNLALCYCGSADSSVSLNLLRKALSPVEAPDDVASLLLAAKICAGKSETASEGVRYAHRALELAKGDLGYLRSCALHVLGVALHVEISATTSDSERKKLQHQALQALQEAAALESEDPSVIFDLGLEYAEQRQLSTALDCAKRFLDRSGGAWGQGWQFLALLLTAQERHTEAEQVLQAAIEETGAGEQGPLLRTQAKVQRALGQSLQAIQTYRQLLALVQVEQKSSGGTGSRGDSKVGARVEEVEVWQDLAEVYTELKQWHDAELCLERARALEGYSATTWHVTGVLHETQGRTEEAMACYKNALSVNAAHVDSKVKLGALLCQRGSKQSLPVARSLLAEALQAEPTHEAAWFQMGCLHKAEGHPNEAADCFQAAVLLEQSLPVEKFRSIPRALSIKS